MSSKSYCSPERGAVAHVMSVGEFCMTTNLLRKLGVKKFSGPFDWHSTNIETILDCLRTRFQRYLDRSHYYYRPIDITQSKTLAGHIRCDHRLYPGSFTHHDPIKNASDYAYLCRCVQRWNSLLMCPLHKAFVRIRRPGPRSLDTESLEDQLFGALCAHTSNFRLIILHLRESAPARSVRIVRTLSVGMQAMHVIEISVQGKQDGMKFTFDEDEMFTLSVLKSQLQPLSIRETLEEATQDDCVEVDGYRYNWSSASNVDIVPVK